jgi:hypothetical protein
MDRKDDRTFSKAGNLNGRSMVGTTDASSAADIDPPAAEHPIDGSGVGLRPGFLAELAVAMRATAEKERERISAKVSDDATGHIDKVRARAAIETDELKRLAEEDVQHIEEWSTAEMERIRAEADRKIEERRGSLEEYLKQHDTIIDTEIEGVNAAVRDYGTTLDQFFAELSQADDPATIVARAEALPAAPDLDQVRAQARASAVAMFADQEDEAAAAEVASEPVVPAASGDAEGITEAVATTPPSEATSGVADQVDGEISGDGAVDARAETTGDATTAQAVTVDPTAEADPVPVMDPDATANPNWPTTPEDAEPVEVAASADHTSAAVRLLRSVAPWTAPTPAGTDDRTNPD